MVRLDNQAAEADETAAVAENRIRRVLTAKNVGAADYWRTRGRERFARQLAEHGIGPDETAALLDVIERELPAREPGRRSSGPDEPVEALTGPAWWSHFGSAREAASNHRIAAKATEIARRAILNPVLE